MGDLQAQRPELNYKDNSFNLFLPLRVYFYECSIFLVPSFILMPHLAGTPGIWLALPVSEAMTFALIAVARLTAITASR